VRVRDLLDIKGRIVHLVTTDATIAMAVARMHDDNIHSLVVMDGDSIAGIFTERDVLAALNDHGASALDCAVGACMTRKPYLCDENATLEQAERQLIALGVRHFPVVRGERLVGVVTLRDVLQRHLTEVDTLADDLRNYIMSSYPG